MTRLVPVHHRHPRRDGVARRDVRVLLAEPRPAPIDPRAVSRRAWAFPVPADPEPARRVEASPAGGPLAAQISRLFAFSRGQAPKLLYDPRV